MRILITWAVYISSKRDFSQEARRNAATQEIRSEGEGQENKKRFDPAVFKVRTLAYRLDGAPTVAWVVTEPNT